MIELMRDETKRTSGSLRNCGVVLAVMIASVVGSHFAHAEAPLKWGADAEGGAPYIFKDPKDPQKNIGFEVDLAAALERETGQAIVFHHYNYKELTNGLKRGDVDFAMNGLEVTPDRLREVRFSRPYYVFSQQLVVRADDNRFQSFEDCRKLNDVKKNLLVGTLENTAAQRILDDAKFTRQLYDDQLSPYVDLELGRIDAVLLDTPIALYFAKPRPKLKLVGPRFGQGYYAIAFRKEDDSLIKQMDVALEKMLKSGELRRIYEKWGLWNEDQDKLAVAQISDVTAESAKAWTPDVYFPYLLDGAWMTVKLSIMSMALAVVLGMLIAVLRLYGPPPLRWLAVGYVEFFRGTPVLLLLFFVYFGLPEIAGYWGLGKYFQIGPVLAAVLAFGFNYAAFEAEIYRAGIASVPTGQWEAAASVGMSNNQTFWRIIMPQAIRTILPP